MKLAAVIELFKNMAPTKLITLIGTFSIVLFLFAFLMLKYSSPNMVILYSDLEIEDSNKIVATLEQMGINYELKANGTMIFVEEDRVLRLRMQLAQDGIPSKGSIVGYEIFDNSDAITTSNFVQNVNLLRALEGELARTISSFNNIKSSRVHLVITKKDLFSKDIQTPSASIVIDIKGAVPLNKDEASAIAHLVATAVPGLDTKMITIVDTRGRPIKVGDGNDQEAVFASKTSSYKSEYENRLKTTIQNLLEKTVGIGGVEAQVTADINFDRLVTNSETFDPDGQVVRSTQTVQENDSSSEDTGDTGDASVLNDIPNNSASSTAKIKANNSTNKTDELINYEISKTVKNFISETGVVKKLSVAVLIDGIYTKNPQTGSSTYTPRSAEELEQYKKLIKSAVGFDESRGDIIEVANLQFKNLADDAAPEESFLEKIKNQAESDLFYIIKMTILSIIGLFVMISFVRPFINKIFDTATSSIQAQIDAEVAIARAEVQQASIKAQAEKETRAVVVEEETQEYISIKKNHTFKSVNDVVDQCPQETIMVVRNWLNS